MRPKAPRPQPGSADRQAALPVSVVIPAFNRADLVARAVQSALRQKPLPPAEVIVVDDHSDDGSSHVAAAAGARVIRHEENRGEGAARNTAIRAASCDWVALLDSDDEWLPNHLTTLWAYSTNHVLVGSTAFASGRDPATGRLWGRERETPLRLRSPPDVLRAGNAIVASSAMVRRDIALAVGGFNESMARGADLDLWLRVLERGPGVVSPIVTVRYHLHDGQVSGDRGSMWDAHRALLASYEERPWCTPRVRRAAGAVLLWDELRAAMRRGDKQAALAAGRSIIFDPTAVASVARLLVVRRQLRRRTARLRPELS